MTSIAKIALAGAAILPLTWLRADDDKKSDDKKVEKRVEVKVLRLDGKDDEKPVVILSDGDEKAEKRVQLKVLRLDGKDGDKEDVRVLLALDTEGTERVQGTEAVTDKNGNYRISMKSAPPPKDGGYYLVFIKEGYERFIVRVKLGPWSALQENTISLKRSQ